jgi:hypothetical protein
LSPYGHRDMSLHHHESDSVACIVSYDCHTYMYTAAAFIPLTMAPVAQ